MEPKLASIVNYYQNKSIFITGASGFLGKVLIEKLLRSCTCIENIYVLIRQSKKYSAEQRFQRLLQNSIFYPLRKKRPEIFEKVILVPGDVTFGYLGISPQNLKLLTENVSIIFHSAASVNFKMDLVTALRCNLEGTKNIIELAKQMKKLKSFVYVSTAYSNCHLVGTQIEELIYPVDFNPRNCYEFFSQLDKLKLLEGITPALVKKKSLTYLFSKRLTEKLVELEARECHLPICIVRPSAIGPIHSDPIELPGWVDTINSITVVAFYTGHGLNYISPADPKATLDIIPVDFVAKIIILAAWEIAQQKQENSQNSIPVYNACIDQFNPVKLETVMMHFKQGAEETPFTWMIRPPSAKMTEKSWWFVINFLAVGLTCILIDIFALCLRQKPRLYTLYRKMQQTCRVGYNVNCVGVKFQSCSLKALRAKIPLQERDMFNLPLEDINWEIYLKQCILGIRRYLEKENDSSIPTSRKNMKRIIWFYSIAKFGIIILLMLVFAKSFNFL